MHVFHFLNCPLIQFKISMILKVLRYHITHKKKKNCSFTLKSFLEIQTKICIFMIVTHETSLSYVLTRLDKLHRGF